MAVLAALVAPAGAQDGGPTTTATSIDGGTVTTPTTPPTTPATLPVVEGEDPTQGEGLEPTEVPDDQTPIPPREVDPTVNAEAGRLLQAELSVAQADAVKLGTSYSTARGQAIALEAELDRVEQTVSELASEDRNAVRRVEAARRHFEARAIAAIIRGRIDDFVPDVPTGDPNEIAAAHTLLGSVLDSDQDSLQEYLDARAATDAGLLLTADRLVTTRNDLTRAREAMVEARRANVSAQINLAVLAAGSDIVIHGFVFPVGTPHSFGNSFGAPRMVGTKYVHAHQGTDILAPMATPLVACERGVVTKVGNDVLGGNTFWIKGESGTSYYYAHLSRYADGMAKGNLVEAGQILGYVGDTGNAKGGPPHLHFEVHPGEGPAVNPYPTVAAHCPSF